jgi:hypothetical protein
VDGFVLDLLRRMGAMDSAQGTTAVLGGAAVGGVLWWLVRHRSRWDPMVALAVWTPVALGIPSLLAAGVVGTVATEDARVAWVAFAGAVGLTLLLRRGLSRQALARAIEQDHIGESELLVRLADSRIVPRSVRDHARYALALSCLRDGDVSHATRLLEGLKAPGVSSHALVLRALIAAAANRLDEADAALAAIPSYARAADLARQRDAVRMLHTLRSGGTFSVQRLAAAEREGVPLARALAAWSHMKAGDLEAVFDLMDPSTRQALRQRGLDRLIPEVHELLDVLPDG